MTDESEVEWVEAGLLDPADPGADETRDLLRYLTGEGLTVADLVTAEREGSLLAAGSEAWIRGHQDQIDLAEMVAQSQVDEEHVVAAWTALGLPVPPAAARVWWPSDAEVFRSFEYASALFGEDQVRQFTRVLGTSMARIADAAVSMFFSQVQAPIEAEHRPSVELARANVAGAQSLDALPPIFETAFRHHLLLATRRSGQSEAGARHRPTLHIGFADQVGSTELAQRLEPAETAELAADFEAVAHQAVSDHSARLVKTIGDGVLFTSVDAGAAARIGRALVEWGENHPLVVGLRVGLHRGPVVWQDGDVYGPSVNLAARVSQLADSGEVLVTAAFADQLDAGEFVLEQRGLHELKGFEGTVPLLSCTMSGEVQGEPSG
jgi:class 3 adenylate cyclase